jgi:hypothetical protein
MSGIPYANGEGVLLSDWGDVIDRHDLLVRCNGFIGVDLIQILDFFDRMRQFDSGQPFGSISCSQFGAASPRVNAVRLIYIRFARRRSLGILYAV